MSFMDWFSNLTGQMGTDMAIDLGTANTLVAMTGEGIVINEPSVVAIEKSTHRVLAVGHEAKNMINHTPDAFSAEHPLHDGVVADYDVTEAMISAFINKAAPRKYPWQAKPRIVICIPCGATSVEKRAVFEAANGNGDRVVPVSTADYYASAAGPVAPRPVHSALDLAKLEATGFSMPDWEERLVAYMRRSSLLAAYSSPNYY